MSTTLDQIGDRFKHRIKQVAQAQQEDYFANSCYTPRQLFPYHGHQDPQKPKVK